ncbi:lysylphosphatidylglycerol synthase transmembrane domain-containing protein [Actinokineospora sp. 24-640]
MRERRRWADVAAIAFVVLACAVAAWALHGEWARVGDALGRMPWWRPVAALALAVLGLLVTAEVWRACLAGLGSTVSPARARRIFFPAQVGKYLPGAVWPFLAQARLARDAGVPAGRALLSGATFLAVHMVTSVLVAATLVVSQPTLAGRFGWLVLAAPAALALLHPRVVRFIAGKVDRSGAGVPPLRWSHVLRPAAWMSVAWVCYGASAWLLAAAFDGPGAQLGLVSAGGFALGWLVGVAVVFAPAGIGAREAVIALVLTPLIGLGAATAVGLLLRVCHTVADIGLAVRFGLIRTSRRDSPRAVQPSGYDAHASYSDRDRSHERQ